MLNSKKVLVLGHKGMLGHMVLKYLKEKEYTIDTTEFKFPTTEFFNCIKTYEGDFVVNCIGAIPQKTDQFDTNSRLPVWLVQNTKCKIIHPGTDCEMDNDEYGISKKTASDYIKSHSTNTKIIKASIIGPELNSRYSLLDWFLNSEDSVNGYTHAMWNGITTLEWAKQCELLMCNWDSFGVETVVSSECVSKYELLCKVRAVFNKSINIIKLENIGIDKCLMTETKTSNIETQLEELKEYYYKNIK